MKEWTLDCVIVMKLLVVVFLGPCLCYYEDVYLLRFQEVEDLICFVVNASNVYCTNFDVFALMLLIRSLSLDC